MNIEKTAIEIELEMQCNDLVERAMHELDDDNYGTVINGIDLSATVQLLFSKGVITREEWLRALVATRTALLDFFLQQKEDDAARENNSGSISKR